MKRHLLAGGIDVQEKYERCQVHESINFSAMEKVQQCKYLKGAKQYTDQVAILINIHNTTVSEGMGGKQEAKKVSLNSSFTRSKKFCSVKVFRKITNNDNVDENSDVDAMKGEKSSLKNKLQHKSAFYFLFI